MIPNQHLFHYRTFIEPEGQRLDEAAEEVPPPTADSVERKRVLSPEVERRARRNKDPVPHSMHAVPTGVPQEPTSRSTPVTTVSKEPTSLSKPVATVSKEATTSSEPVSIASISKEPTSPPKHVATGREEAATFLLPFSSIATESTTFPGPFSNSAKESTTLLEPVATSAKEKPRTPRRKKLDPTAGAVSDTGFLGRTRKATRESREIDKMVLTGELLTPDKKRHIEETSASSMQNEDGSLAFAVATRRRAVPIWNSSTKEDAQTKQHILKKTIKKPEVVVDPWKVQDTDMKFRSNEDDYDEEEHSSQGDSIEDL